MRILKYLGKHPVAIMLTVLLLVVQAYCDLSLPNYTSDIVDVGIQQKGVEHPALTQMSADTYDNLSLLIGEGDDLTFFQDSYAQQDDGTYAMTAEGKKQISVSTTSRACPRSCSPTYRALTSTT